MILIHIIAVLIFLSYVWNSLHNKIFKVSPILHLPQDFEILHLPKLSLPLVSSERAGSQWGRGKIQVISSLPWRTQVLPQTIQGATECSRAIRQAGRTETSTVRVFHHLLLLLPIRDRQVTKHTVISLLDLLTPHFHAQSWEVFRQLQWKQIPQGTPVLLQQRTNFDF